MPSEFQLFQALKNGKVREIKECLQFELDVNYTDPDGKTAMQVLLESHDEPNHEIVQSLLEKKSDLDIIDDRGRSLFMLACEHGYTKIVELMLRFDPPMDMKDYDGNNALMVASQLGYTPIVRMLISRGATVYAQNDNMWTALMFAASCGNKRTVNELLVGKSNVMVADGDQQTAMLLAAQNGNCQCCELLISYNAEVNAADRWGQSCLYLASGAGHVDVVKLLLSAHDILVNQMSDDKKTPLDYACEKGRSEIVQLLKEREGVPNQTMGEAMYFAVEKVEEIRESFDGWSQVEAKKVRLAHVFAKQAVAELLKIDIVQDATSCGIEQSLDAWESEVRDMTHSVASAKPSSDAKKDEHLEYLELENFTFLISTEINRYSEHRFQSPSGLCGCMSSPKPITKVIFELFVTCLASKTRDGNYQLRTLQDQREKLHFFKRVNRVME